MINSAEEFVRLRSSELPEEYWRAAHEEASDVVWLDVIARFPDMRWWVAQNKTVPLSMLEILARDADVSVRSMVAHKRKLSPALFDLLSQDSEGTVRSSIANNRKVPMHILKRLADDPEAFIREAVLKRLERGKG